MTESAPEPELPPETPSEENKKNRKSRARYIGVGIGLLLMVALVVFVNSSLFTDGLAALKVGDVGYTVADVNYEYQKNYMQLSQYFSSYFDSSKPLKDQDCPFLSDGGRHLSLKGGGAEALGEFFDQFNALHKTPPRSLCP